MPTEHGGGSPSALESVIILVSRSESAMSSGQKKLPLQKTIGLDYFSGIFTLHLSFRVSKDILKNVHWF